MSNCELFFLFLNQNICYGYLKEPSQRDGSVEHPKQMFKLMGKKIITILHQEFLWDENIAVVKDQFTMKTELKIHSNRSAT